MAEGEAVQRAIALAELVDVPILIVHVSDAAGASAIRQAQTRGLRVYGETCPQYLFLTADDLDRPGLEGAKYGCSPPPRDRASQEAIWRGLADGTFQAYSSDHAPYRFDESGKLPKGAQHDVQGHGQRRARDRAPAAAALLGGGRRRAGSR